MADVSVAAQVAKKWRKKRGSLIMALHELQEIKGYVPWEDASELAVEINIPLARIYEVLTFYNFFKLEAPGKAVISVCTGTACGAGSAFTDAGADTASAFGVSTTGAVVAVLTFRITTPSLTLSPA